MSWAADRDAVKFVLSRHAHMQNTRVLYANKLGTELLICWAYGLQNHVCMQCSSSEHLCACNMPHSDFWIVNEKLIWRGSEAGVRVRGAAHGNSKSLYMMRFQLVHYSHCYLCNSGSCQYPEGVSAGERKLDISSKAFFRKRKAGREGLNHTVSINSRWSF